MSGGLAEALAAWHASLAWDAVPARQRELVTLRLLDTLGLIARGARSDASRIASAYAQRVAATGGATLVGAPAPVPAAFAGFVHGVAAHCLDFDDTFPDSVVHPGSAVVPTAIAAGEEARASGAEIATAIAGGYEIAARLAGVGVKRFHERGFHPTAVFAPLVAAFVAAKILRLDPKTTASAAGLAASMSGGLLAFLGDGSWSKWLHLGWGNFGGITAALLARDGFRGPHGALDDRHNLFETFVGVRPDRAEVEAGLGQVWRNETAIFKVYPCAHVIAPYIDLALAVRERLPDASAVTRITCVVAPWAVPIVCEPVREKTHPVTTMGAIASLPYNVASALLDGKVDLETIEERNLARADVSALAMKTGYRVDPNLRDFQARLEVETKGGAAIAQDADAATPRAQRLRAKFAMLVSGVVPPSEEERCVSAVADFATAPDAEAIARFLREAK